MASTQQTQTKTVNFNVHPNDVGYLLGSKGTTMRKISCENGVTITYVPYNRYYAPDTPPHFAVNGPSQNVDNTITLYYKMCSENLRRQWITSEKNNNITAFAMVPKEDMPMVIGKGGKTIKAINKQYKVQSKTTTDNGLNVTGFSGHVRAAIKHIKNIVEESQKRRGVQPKNPYDQGEANAFLAGLEEANRPHTPVYRPHTPTYEPPTSPTYAPPSY
jgi:predicted RNA-binding protein YlqC (UPF0109 family)